MSEKERCRSISAKPCPTRSGYLSQGQISDMQTTVSGEGTLIFYWKTSSLSGDCLEFFVDGTRHANPISGETSWTQVSLGIEGEGNHALLWRYTKNNYNSSGDNRGYVDYLQWSGDGPIEPPPEWEAVSYTYDPSGRRIEKKVDGDVEVKFIYDGQHCIAEYDGSNTLLRKYVHGPDIDKPICMTEASGDYAGTYYYHYDALGSVVALTNSAGSVVQLYDYSVYGQVAASDPEHPNRFMFTSREFDKDTGLYYYRARYYNPEIGRFLQTDPIGYEDGMNLYRYCRNNPLTGTDSSGLRAKIDKAMITYMVEGDEIHNYQWEVNSWDDFYEFMKFMESWGRRITYFEFVGHGVGVGLQFGDGDVLGIGPTPEGEEDAYYHGIEDYESLLQTIFHPQATIELEACHSAEHEGAIAYSFKAILPEATVWGYTGFCRKWPFVWETFADFNSDWVLVELGDG